MPRHNHQPPRTAALPPLAGHPGPDDEFGDDVRGEATQGESPPETPVGRLRANRAYWYATMHQIGSICPFTLSVIDHGYQPAWDSTKGPPTPCWLPNHPSARAGASFVTEKVNEGVQWGTIRQCPRSDVQCVLPLGVAANAAGKQRLIWDGRHVNRFLPEHPFRMETLQREGRALFEHSSWGGTCDLSSAYHHIPMHPESMRYLGFEWEHKCYCFTVLPFGLATAPWLFTKVMGHCVRFLRSPGMSMGILCYLDDVVFAAKTARGALGTAQTLINVLRRFGWLVHPTKCVGTTQALQAFQALGTYVDLANQTFSIPAAAAGRILEAAASLANGPDLVPVRRVARLKGLLAATWVSTGLAARLRTRAFDAVIDSRPHRNALGQRNIRKSWASLVTLTPEARAEASWWTTSLHLVNGQPIRPQPFNSLCDGDVYSDASEKGSGAFIRSLPGSLKPSSLVQALLARCEGCSAAEVTRYAEQGIEFAASLPADIAAASSTHRELFSVASFILAIAPLLRGGRFRVFLDNLGCVFILGGIVPAFATGGRQWGDYVSGGSPNPALQALALKLFQSQLDGGFSLQAVWLPRELNTRADYLSRVSEMRHHDYRLRPQIFRLLDEAWGPHSIDRFASSENKQTSRFCSHFFHPEAVWVDSFSTSWAGETNWLFPPATPSAISRTIAHLCADGARGTLIVPMAPWSAWRPLLRPRDAWAPFVLAVHCLGPPPACLNGYSRYWDLLRCCTIYALRVDGRLASPPHGPP